MRILKQWLNHPQLRRIQQTRKACARMTQTLETVLESRFQGLCQVTSFDESTGVLTIAAVDASMATQLRFQASMLAPILRKRLHLPSLKSIRVHVQMPTTGGPQKPKRRAVKPSCQGSAHLEQAAEHCQHEALKAALKRLAKHRTSQ